MRSGIDCVVSDIVVCILCNSECKASVLPGLGCSPLKFLMTSFLADPGLLLANGDAFLLNPLLGLVSAEKFAFFCCVSVIFDVVSSFNFLPLV